MKEVIFLQISLYLLKILGGFPFRRKEEKASVISETSVLKSFSSKPHRLDLRKVQYTQRLEAVHKYELSRGWKLWSSVVFATVLCYLVYTILVLFSYYESSYSHYDNTFFVAKKIRVFICSASIVLMMAYFRAKRRVAKDVMTRLQMLITSVHVTSEKTFHIVSHYDQHCFILLFILLHP